MIKEMKEAAAASASALGAKTARACDSCIVVRARWYCAADDAFLCHGCDTLVHSANQLASRHERVRLQTSSSKLNHSSWHSGFTRKARTPRHKNKYSMVQQQQKEEKEVFLINNTNTLLPLVPELGNEEPFLLEDDENNEEQLLCRVPVFDGVVEEEAFDLDNFSSEFLPSDMDLAEFAADVEGLLNVDHEGSYSGHDDVKKGVEEDACGVGVVGVGDKDAMMVKVKDEEELGSILDDMSSEAFDWNINESESVAVAAKEEVPLMASSGVSVGHEVVLGTKKKEIFLRLNYEEVITAWASQGSPWTTGSPPKFNSHDCWPDFLGSSGTEYVQSSYGDQVRSLIMGQQIGGGDGGREARVSRYREKRRTRLFAKKIRYEVRKLNAEKRPRMKGRFVKRTSFVNGATTALQP